MRIEDHLRETAVNMPDKTALVVGGIRMSYRDLDAQSDRVASALAARGVARGDRVLLVADNSAEAVVALYAVVKAGAIACPLNPQTRADKFSAICARIEPAAMIMQARLGGMAERVCSEDMPRIAIANDGAELRSGWIDFGTLAAGASLSESVDVGRPGGAGGAGELALLIHTSGSTGVPKGVMLTHDNVTAACTAIVTYLENTAEDIILSVLPLSFGYGLTQVVTAAMCGATLVLEKSFAFPRVILKRMAEEGVTGFPLVPTMAALLLQMKDLSPGFLPKLRYITSAAAQLPPVMSMGLRSLFPDAQLCIMYGQTECLRATWLPPQDVALKPTSAGIAIPGGEVAVVDERGVPVAPGVIGELVVRGPHVMQGYWRDEAATAAALRPAPEPWGRELRTGDLFRMDEDGYFYFVTRNDDIIITRGEKVSPQEVERVLYAFEGIREAAVVGTADPILGEAVKAVIVAEPGRRLDEREIIRHCARFLEDFMVPKAIEFRDSLPRTASGKIRLEEQHQATEATA